MTGRTTMTLLLAVVIVGGYILFHDLYRASTDQRASAARLAFHFEPETTAEIRIDTPAGLFALTRTNQNWRLVHPVSAAADHHAIHGLLDALAGLRWSQIITPDEQKTLQLKPDHYGFNPPRVTITITDHHQTLTVWIGRDAPGGHELYLKRSDREDIVVASREILLTLPGSVMDLRDRRLIALPPARVRRIEWQAKDRVFQASRTGDDQWFLERPVYARASGGALRQWLNRLYEFRIFDFIAESVAAGSLYGFDEPTLQLSLTGDPGSAPYVLKIGHPVDVGRTAYYATIQGQDHVFSVQADVVEWLTPETRHFRDHRLSPFQIMEIQSIQMTDGEQTLQLLRNTQGVWEVTSPKRFPAHDAHVQLLLGAWSGALVEQFIDPPITDWALYGLEQTNRWIRFTRSPVLSPASASAAVDREIVLFIGGAGAHDRFYVTPANRGYVMELPGALRKTFTVDPLAFRDPVVLALDNTGIQRISQQSDGVEWTVDLSNGLYRAVNPLHAPDTDAIHNILYQIGHLTTARFVEEDPRDLSPYGLDRPRHQVLFSLASGGINRVLWIGREAGDGERYVMRQGTDVVFTLTEEVIRILLRPVANPLTPPGWLEGAAPE